MANTPPANIYAALKLDPNDSAAMQAAVFFYGGVFFTLDVPEKWYKAYETGAIWDAPAKADGNNGHGVWWNGVDINGNYKLQSWGTYGWITPAGVKVCDPGAFCVFSPRWFNTRGIAPNGMTYNQLAVLWAQFGGKPLPYQTRIFESATTFANETDGTWTMANYDKDDIPDLVFIKTNNTPSGHVEVHVASGASNYQTRIFEGVTTFANESDGTWLMADYDKDHIPDLVFIKTNNTPTGHVEVHVASGASNYQTRIFEGATTFANETDGTWTMANYDKDHIPDLVFIKTNNTPSGNVEVHVASGSSKYQKRIFEADTTFVNENDGTWLMADYDKDSHPDLVFIKTSNTPYGTVEVHVASGASKFKKRIFESVTTFANESDGTWLLTDYSKHGDTDLVFIKTNDTPNGHVEVHISPK